MVELTVNRRLVIPAAALEERFVTATGPGGQNVNKVATAVQLRFDPTRCPGLDAAARHRLRRLAGGRMTQGGILVIRAERFRQREKNREDARERLVGLLRRALQPQAPRRPTTKPAKADARRLERKRRRGAVKALRRVGDADPI